MSTIKLVIEERPIAGQVRDDLAFVEPGALIHQIQQELLEAENRREAAGLLPLFEVEGLEIEMRVAITRVTQRGGKIDLKLVAIAGTTKSTQVTPIQSG